MPSPTPDALALALLSLPDPLPELRRLAEAEDPSRAAPVLHALKDRLARGEAHPTLRAMPLELTLGDRTIHLDLLLLPSIFEPEAWGMTFLEGLLRKPLRDYRGKRLVELGTGSGWVSLALLRFTELEAVLGVDLNPQAALVSRLNAVLNGYDAGGRELPDRLAARFSSAESDLLAEPRARGFAADLVVGCIPQVLATEADFGSAQGLLDLSNYTTAQGLVEDQFGLGLNARALRESLSLLEPGGRVILNLAGRPGQGVLTRMFQRRGFEPEVLWRSRVQQAGDTDIEPLVELEARTGQPFAFHLHRHSPESVSARVALTALRGGLPIFHELLVVEGRPKSEALFPLARTLEDLGMVGLWERVDLTESSDEQLQFVTHVAEAFRRRPELPYPHEAGDPDFRRRVADFLRKFHSLPLSPEEAFAAPSRAELIHALLLSLVEPGEKVVLSSSLREVFAPALRKYGADPVWVHDDPDEVAELLPLLRPRLVVVAPPPRGAHPKGALRRLLGRCQELDALLVLDESDRFQISSRGPENPSLTFMAQHLDAPHLAILVGLVHSQAFPDLELGLLFGTHPRLRHALEAAAELTWSRISWLSQAYYGSLFDELLTFRVNAPAPGPVRLPEGTPAPALRPAMEALLTSPPFARPAPDADVVRLDYGENEHAVPSRLLGGLLRGLLLPPGAPSEEARARRAALDYLRATRLPEAVPEDLLLGAGTLPPLFDALRALAHRQGRTPAVALPEGSYGMFAPLLAAAGAEVRLLPTAAPDFLATEAAVREAAPFDALLLTHPANPSGASYAPEALAGLVRQAASRGAKVILDEVFGLLAALDGPAPLGQDRWAGLSAAEREAVLILCGTSKECAAGGLRLGLAAGRDRAWLAEMEALQLTPLPQAVRVAAQDLYRDFRAGTAELESLRGDLRRRRALLAEGLLELGFGLAPDWASRGGLFLFPDVTALAARKTGGDPEAFVLRAEAEARVRLNTPRWSGTAAHARACFSIPEPRIEEALRRLRAWLKGA